MKKTLLIVAALTTVLASCTPIQPVASNGRGPSNPSRHSQPEYSSYRGGHATEESETVDRGSHFLDSVDRFARTAERIVRR